MRSGKDWFRPVSFLGFYSLFLVLAVIGFTREFPIQPKTLNSFIVVLATFPFFYIGVHYSKKAYGKKVPPQMHRRILVALILLYIPIIHSFNVPLWLSAVISVASGAGFYFIVKKYKKQLNTVKFFWATCSVGLFFLGLTFVTAGGIPLFNSALRRPLTGNIFWGLAMLVFTAGFAFLLPRLKKPMEFWGFSVFSIVLFSLAAFRSMIVLLVLMVAFTAYYTKRISLKGMVIPFIVVVLVISGLGYYVQPLLNPVDLVLYRASTTHLVFEEVMYQSFPTGLEHGAAFMHGNPRDYVGSLLGKDANLTYTFLGAAFLDFWIWGAAVWMTLMGFLLGLAYEAAQKDKLFKGMYPMLFALALTWIELGIEPFKLLFFWFFLILYMIRYEDEGKGYAAPHITHEVCAPRAFHARRARRRLPHTRYARWNCILALK